MWVAVAIVVLAVLMMVGPLMAIRPTKSQSRLAGLRQLALKEGLSVRMRQDPSAYQKGLIAVYTLHLPGHQNNQTGEKPPEQNKNVRKANRWLLTRREYSHELHFQGEWDWRGEDRPALSLQKFLKQHVMELDDSFLAVESSGHSFGVYWTERLAGKTAGQRVGEVAAWLKALTHHEPAVEGSSS